MNHYNIPHAAMSQPTSLPSPGEEPSREIDHSEEPTPPPVSTFHDGKIWALEVVQQPIRARMCGFGDKDRRPITPPPCIRLIVMDATTKQEIDINTIDTAFFVLTVDLWNWEANKEVNLVKSSQSNSPAISTVAPASYPYTQSNMPSAQSTPKLVNYKEIPAYRNNSTQFDASPMSGQYSASTASPYSIPSAGSMYANGGQQGYPVASPYQRQDTRNSYSGQYTNGYQQPNSASSYSSQNGNHMMSPYQSQQNRHQPPTQNNLYGPSQDGTPSAPQAGMYTRNLIGSLTASAFKLHDTSDKYGIWFILQDLSVRTEGWFRLKINFVNVGQPMNIDAKNAPDAVKGMTHQTVKKTTAPVLASTFTKPFQVFSAKKFPGVIESTELSKIFATQGIKIPIRKEPAGTSGKRKAGEEADEEEGDE